MAGARPKLRPCDLMAAVKGISVNPVDVKLRADRAPEGLGILKFDTAGVVVETGLG